MSNMEVSSEASIDGSDENHTFERHLSEISMV